MTTTSETTEVVLRDGQTALVPVEFSTNYPGLAPDEDTALILAENLGDQDIQLGNFKRIKVPSGELNSWMVPAKGEDKAFKALKGILVAWQARRSFWVDEGNPDGSQPDCYSTDNKVPVSIGMYHPEGARGAQNPQGRCATCPMSKPGSTSQGGRGSACREQRLLFLMLEGSLFPVIVHAPRTSIKPLTGFMMDLMDSRQKYWMVEVELGLEKAKNSNGQTYNVIRPKAVRDLDPEEAKAVQVYGEQIRAMVDAATSDFSSVEGDEGGISVGEPDA